MHSNQSFFVLQQFCIFFSFYSTSYSNPTSFTDDVVHIFLIGAVPEIKLIMLSPRRRTSSDHRHLGNVKTSGKHRSSVLCGCMSKLLSKVFTFR